MWNGMQLEGNGLGHNTWEEGGEPIKWHSVIYGIFKFVDDSKNRFKKVYHELVFSEKEKKDVHNDGYNGDANSIKYVYQDSIWQQKFIIYDQKLEGFLCCFRSNFLECQIPSFCTLFKIFWVV